MRQDRAAFAPKVESVEDDSILFPSLFVKFLIREWECRTSFSVRPCILWERAYHTLPSI